MIFLTSCSSEVKNYKPKSIKLKSNTEIKISSLNIPMINGKYKAKKNSFLYEDINKKEKIIQVKKDESIKIIIPQEKLSFVEISGITGYIKNEILDEEKEILKNCDWLLYLKFKTHTAKIAIWVFYFETTMFYYPLNLNFGEGMDNNITLIHKNFYEK